MFYFVLLYFNLTKEPNFGTAMQLVGRMKRPSSPLCFLSNEHIICLTPIISVRMGCLLCVIFKSVICLHCVLWSFLIYFGRQGYVLKTRPFHESGREMTYPTRSLENYFFFFWSSCQLLFSHISFSWREQLRLNVSLHL